VPQSSTLTYLAGDHLGSTSLAVDTSTNAVTKTRYKPWGEVRWTSENKTLPTRYTFTGQYSYMDDEATDLGAAGFGLMFYNARWYDPTLGRFAQADSIVSLASQGTQALDRYAFVNNNPVRYNDPTGHSMTPGEAGGEPGCTDPLYCDNGQPASPGLIQARKIFNDMADESDIAWDFSPDGCYARAHLMNECIDERYGIAADKIWAFGTLTVDSNGFYGTITWGWHVAPIITVTNPDGSTETYVIDPSIADGPVSVDEWLGIMTTDISQIDSVQRTSSDQIPNATNPGPTPRDPYDPTGALFPGSGYWLWPDPTTFGGPHDYSVAVMQHYQWCADNNIPAFECINDRPSPY
jgi:RHS repeat-associated protein